GFGVLGIEAAAGILPAVVPAADPVAAPAALVVVPRAFVLVVAGAEALLGFAGRAEVAEGGALVAVAGPAGACAHRPPPPARRPLPRVLGGRGSGVEGLGLDVRAAWHPHRR